MIASNTANDKNAGISIFGRATPDATVECKLHLRNISSQLRLTQTAGKYVRTALRVIRNKGYQSD
jgi:hypothetical protein